MCCGAARLVRDGDLWYFSSRACSPGEYEYRFAEHEHGMRGRSVRGPLLSGMLAIRGAFLRGESNAASKTEDSGTIR